MKCPAARRGAAASASRYSLIPETASVALDRYPTKPIRYKHGCLDTPAKPVHDIYRSWHCRIGLSLTQKNRNLDQKELNASLPSEVAFSRLYLYSFVQAFEAYRINTSFVWFSTDSHIYGCFARDSALSETSRSA